MEQVRSPAAWPAFTPLSVPTRVGGVTPAVESKRLASQESGLPLAGAATPAPGPLASRRVEPLPQTVRELRERIARRFLDHRQVIEAFVSDRIEHAVQQARLAGTPVRLDDLGGLDQALWGDRAKGADLSAVMDALRRWRHGLPVHEVARIAAMLAPMPEKGEPQHDLQRSMRWDYLLRPMYWPPGAERSGASFLASLCDQVEGAGQRTDMARYIVRQLVAQLSDPIALALPMAQRVRLRQAALDIVIQRFARPGGAQADAGLSSLLADEIGGSLQLAPPERIGLLAGLLAPNAWTSAADRALLAGPVLLAMQRVMQAGMGPRLPGPCGLGDVLRLLAPCALPAAPAGGLRSIAVAAGLFGDLVADRSARAPSDARAALGPRIAQRLRDLLPLFQAHDRPWMPGVLVYEAARAARRQVDDGFSPVPALVRAIAEAGAGFTPARQRVMAYALAVAWDRIDPLAQDRWGGFDAALADAVQQDAVRNEPSLAPLVGARVTRLHASAEDEAHLLELACRILDPDTPLREQVARAERMAPPLPRYGLLRRVTENGLVDASRDATAAFPADRFDAWQRATLAQLADFEAPVNDPMAVAYTVQRPEPVGPDADLPLVIPPLPQRLQAVQSSYLGLEALAGLFPIHRLPDDASAREAARGARTALESARVRIGRIDADLRAALDGRVSATIPLLQDMERQREAVQRALRLADGPSAGAVDGAQGPDPARPRREARGLPGMREALRVASRCLTPWA